MTHEGALVVNVKMREESGMYYAHSPDLLGLHVCGDSIEQTCERVLKAIKAIFKHSRKMIVDVVPTSDAESFPRVKGVCDQFVVQRIAA